MAELQKCLDNPGEWDKEFLQRVEVELAGRHVKQRKSVENSVGKEKAAAGARKWDELFLVLTGLLVWIFLWLVFGESLFRILPLFKAAWDIFGLLMIVVVVWMQFMR